MNLFHGRLRPIRHLSQCTLRGVCDGSDRFLHDRRRWFIDRCFAHRLRAGANTLNVHVRPNLPVNTTLHVDVKPRLYRDVVLAESCGTRPKRNDQVECPQTVPVGRLTAAPLPCTDGRGCIGPFVMISCRAILGTSQA